MNQVIAIPVMSIRHYSQRSALDPSYVPIRLAGRFESYKLKLFVCGGSLVMLDVT